MRDTTRRLSWLLAGAVGVVAFAVGLSPGVAALLPVEAAVDWLGNDYVLLGSFGGVALAVLTWMVLRRATGRVDQARPPAPETVPDAPRPGEGVDERLGKWPWRLDSDDRELLRDRLRTDAISHQMAAGASRATASERVDAGEWPDDSTAAAFLAGETPALPGRALLLLRGASWSQHGARAAAEALTDRDEERQAETTTLSGSDS